MIAYPMGFSLEKSRTERSLGNKQRFLDLSLHEGTFSVAFDGIVWAALKFIINKLSVMNQGSVKLVVA